MGIHVKYVFGDKEQGKEQKRIKKEKRDRKAFELLRNVSALRNSNSGCVLVHLVGLAPEDSFTGAFDEFADSKLYELIQDGKQFSDVYRKEVLNSNCACHGFGDFLVLYVGASSIVTTCKFNTKVTLDDCIIDICAQTLRTFVRERKSHSDKFHTLPGVTNTDHLQNVQENRSVQMKSHFLQKKDGKEIAEYIIKNHKLAEYISAFTKIECGGSFLYGVHQMNCFLQEYGYETKVNRIQPVVLGDRTVFRDTLEDSIRNTVLVCDYDGDRIQDSNIFQIEFIPCTRVNDEHDDEQAVVVHVAVRPVSGIVFYDKQGPLAYRYDKRYKVITRIDIKEWIRALTKGRASLE
ncbi:uncharacterized protein [Haliotis asinina]|uniref:uncharacterized protein n=1 Tax=Haliotis asinina TaxID=109174 RepID=UPI00353194CF